MGSATFLIKNFPADKTVAFGHWWGDILKILIGLLIKQNADKDKNV
jgi:hypothetical protein